jgi:YHS domain-containing protein
VAQDHQQHGQTAEKSEPVNAMCPIGKEPIVASAGTVEYDGHTIGLCCPGCGKQFLAWDEQRKDEFVRASLEGEHRQAQSKKSSAHAGAADGPSYPYTLDTCPVSGEKLGSMGDPVVREYDGREVRFCCAGCIDAFESDKAKHWSEIDERTADQQRMHYPLDNCIVTGEKLGDDAVDHVHNNRLVRLADADAAEAFAEHPEKYLAALDERIVELQLEDYPMEKCPVGGPLGSMGEPVNFIYMNRLVRFCCGGCENSLVSEPDTYMGKLDQAYADAQREDYPLQTCPVRGAKLGSMGEPVEVVAGTQLVRFCCKGCLPTFRESPDEYLTALEKSKRESGG